MLAIAVVLVVSAACSERATITATGQPVSEEVETSLGTLRGAVLEGVQPEPGAPERARLLGFMGVPFAAPPVGPRRFEPPQPARAWPGTRDATQPAPACWQPEPASDSFYGHGPDHMSEDCLYLNIWTPAHQSGERLPVMVWIHGGGLVSGHAGVWAYDGQSLASRGVVVVTVQYRLGPLGFLAHPLLAADGETSRFNLGLRDQIAALEWVAAEISSFGGDPDNTTIFGESAGSSSVLALTATPRAAGLFARAIGQSGAPLQPRDRVADLSSPGHGTYLEALRAADLLPTESASELEALRALAPADFFDPRVLEAVRNMSFGPIQDGDLLDDQIGARLERGDIARIPMILGSNEDQASVSYDAVAPASVPEYREWLALTFGDWSDDFYGQYSAVTDDHARDAFLALHSDLDVGWPMRQWALSLAEEEVSVWFYRWRHAPPSEERERWGAFHGAEIPYVFSNLHRRSLATGRLEIGETDRDRRLADTMASYWVQFARSGNPNGDGLPEWPVFEPPNETVLLVEDEVGAGTLGARHRMALIEAWQKRPTDPRSRAHP